MNGVNANHPLATRLCRQLCEDHEKMPSSAPHVRAQLGKSVPAKVNATERVLAKLQIDCKSCKSPWLDLQDTLHIAPATGSLGAVPRQWNGQEVTMGTCKLQGRVRKQDGSRGVSGKALAGSGEAESARIP
jgi:hypothetical protein